MRTIDLKPDPKITASPFWRLAPAGMNRRWWLFRVFDWLARMLPLPKRRKGLLVVRMDGIGDMVLFRAAMARYADAFGVDQKDITVLGCHSWRSIAGDVYAGFKVVTIDEHAYARNLIYRFYVNMRVRCLAPAITTCDSYFRRALMADSLVWVSGAPKTVVSLPYISEDQRAVFTYYLSQVDRIIDTGPYPTHEIDRHDRFLAAITDEIFTSAAPSLAWRKRSSMVPAGVPYVVLNPGSNEFGRRWPLTKYAAIGHRARDAGFRLVVVGAGDESQDDAAMAQLLAETGVINLIGRTSLTQLLDVMKGAACVLTNDTGPAHLSIAVGTPTVVVVGGGHFGSFVPYPKNMCPDTARFVFEEMDCYHCFWRCPKRDTKFQSFPCVVAVSEQRVWDNVQAVLSAESTTAETTA